MKKTKIKAWAGFVEDNFAYTLEYYGDRLSMPAIYKRKKDAMHCYEDVRKVEIKVIK